LAANSDETVPLAALPPHLAPLRRHRVAIAADNVNEQCVFIVFLILHVSNTIFGYW
jgi:hypothetical protein